TARGYRVLGRQVRRRYGVRVDGAEHAVDLRADYVVEHEGARFVAEVKTGRLAPRLDTPATRRQLLEYRVAFEVDGVLLVDAEAGRVHAVEFPLEARAGRRRGVGALVALAAVLGAIAALGVERFARP
ncbi:MAG TPA: hypothetical protein VHB21_24420, partial [Minicystis sp.]|nr:hypothetical protein [Minicystis sp.]